MKKSLFLISLTLFLSSCSPIFVIKATLFEAEILLNRKSINQILNEEDINAEKKKKLQLVLDAREFSQKIGLNPKGSFSKYSEIKNKTLLWVISASEKNKFKAKHWWFPIVGSIPYKGFFNKEDAIKSAKELKEQNYDTYLRPSDAFSTLGWFDDPILSTTLSKNELTIVNTVIHEIVHNTIWVKNNAYFNETMANAIAALATIEFFRGIDNENYNKAKKSIKNETSFSILLENTINDLKTLYSKNLNEKNISEQELSRKKEEILNSYKQGFKEITDREIKLEVNNAYLIAQEIYYKNFNSFIKEYNSNGESIKKLITYLKEISKESEPYKRLMK